MPNTDNQTIHQKGIEAIEKALDDIFTRTHNRIIPSLTMEDGDNSPRYQEFMRINMELEVMRCYAAESGNTITFTINRKLQDIVGRYLNERLMEKITLKPIIQVPKEERKPITPIAEPSTPPEPKGGTSIEKQPPTVAPAIQYKYPEPIKGRPTAILANIGHSISVSVLTIDGREQTYKDPSRYEYLRMEGRDTLVIEINDGLFDSITTYNRKNIIKVSEKRSITEE